MDTIERVPACPRTNVENQPFWDAAAQGTLLLKRCRACGASHYYPRAHCPHCLGPDTEWIASTGRGSVYSFSVMRRVPAPYAIAYVTLDEGVTLMTNIVGCDLDRIAIGMRVRVGFRPSDGALLIPIFVPA
jgi:uncharacterized OB-fold protein